MLIFEEDPLFQAADFTLHKQAMKEMKQLTFRPVELNSTARMCT